MVNNNSIQARNATRRPHAVRREEAAERMVKAAVKIVAERGLEELTLAGCGEAAGYSRGLAPHYFGSKEGLLGAIASHIVDDYSRRLRAHRRTRAGLAGILESIEFYIDSGRSNSLHLRAFHAVLGSALKWPALTDAIAALNRNSIDSFARLIASARERGEIRGDIDPHAQASLIMAGLRGVMTQWLIDPVHIDLDAIKQEFCRNTARALAK